MVGSTTSTPASRGSRLSSAVTVAPLWPVGRSGKPDRHTVTRHRRSRCPVVLPDTTPAPVDVFGEIPTAVPAHSGPGDPGWFDTTIPPSGGRTNPSTGSARLGRRAAVL